MRKIFAGVFAGIFSAVFTLNAYAASINVKDPATDLISVSGTVAEHNSAVTLVVLNPGYTEDSISGDAYADQSAVIQYFSVAYPQNGAYNFDVAMRDTTVDGGGAYKFIVTVGDERVHNGDYLFYFNDVKLGIISTINSQSTISEDTVADAYYKFGLSNIPLYADGNLAKIVSAIGKARESMREDDAPAGAIPAFELDVSKFDLVLRKAALLGAYNDSDEDLVTENGYIIYPDLLGIESQQVWTDYKSELSADAVEDLNEELIDGTYDSVEEITAALREYVAFYGLISNKDGGFEHFDTFFSNYSDVYSKYNFKTNLITDRNKNYVYNKLLDSNVSNIDRLGEVFNSIIADYEKSDRNNNGGGSSSGGSSMGGTVTTDAYIIPEIGFDDLTSAEWARTSVIALAEKGVISGKAKRIFAPNDYVTRAEFLKMLLAALEISGTQTDCAFADVDGHWAKQYIITASETGIANGMTDTTFEPNGIIKREMGAVFLNRALMHKGINLVKDEALFADDSLISDYAKDSVYCLKYAGIIGGVGGNNFDSQGYMTRAQAAKMIYEVMIYSEGEANK